MALDKPPPVLSALDVRDGGGINTKLGSKHALFVAAGANGADLILCKFGVWVFCAFVCSSVAHAILHVFLSRSPREIFKTIVCSCSILMSCIKTSAVKSSKGAQHNAMDGIFQPDIFPAQRHDQIAMRAGVRRQRLFLETFWASVVVPNYAGIAANVPMVGNRIKAFVANDWQPLFTHHLSPSKVGIMAHKGKLQWP